MKRILVFALALAACHSSKGPEQPKLPPARPEAVLALKDAARSVRLGPANYERALEKLKGALEIVPGLWEAWYDEGWLLLKLHRPVDAAPALEKARAIVPSSARVTEALGQAYVASGRPGDAASVYRDYLGRVDDPAVRVAYAGALRRAGKLDDAIAAAREALKTAERSAPKALPVALNEMAMIYLARGQVELADLVLHKALDLDGKSKIAAETWNNLGLVALKRRHDQDAFAAFDQAVKLDPSLEVARRNKAAVYLDCGDYGRATDELKRLTRDDDDDVQAWVALGVAERGQGKLADAARAYEHALDLAPGQPDALYDLGVLEMDFRRRPEKAAEHLTEFLKVAPASHPKRADAQSRMQDLARALAKSAPAAPKSNPGGAR